MKKVFTIIVIGILVFSLSLSALAVGEFSTNKLSDLSENGCISFLENHGVSIPDELADMESFGAFAKYLVECFEENPNYPIAFNYSVTANFVAEVRNAVNTYYNRTAQSILDAYGEPNLRGLQDSTQYTNWTAAMANYNCYAYSMGYTSQFVDPGFFSGTNTWTISSVSLSTLANCIKSDLIQRYGISSSNISVSSTRPTASGLTVYAIRKGQYDASPYYADYHVMKYTTSTASWLHKPGSSAILRYKYTPSTSRNWTNEMIGVGQNYWPSTITYSGTIYYIYY